MNKFIRQLPSLFLDLANASTHTNYLIQIVKEHLLSFEFIEVSEKSSINIIAQQRSGSLAVFLTT
jgi:hypothetical protein